MRKRRIRRSCSSERFEQNSYFSNDVNPATKLTGVEPTVTLKEAINADKAGEFVDRPVTTSLALYYKGIRNGIRFAYSIKKHPPISESRNYPKTILPELLSNYKRALQ